MSFLSSMGAFGQGMKTVDSLLSTVHNRRMDERKSMQNQATHDMTQKINQQNLSQAQIEFKDKGMSELLKAKEMRMQQQQASALKNYKMALQFQKLGKTDLAKQALGNMPEQAMFRMQSAFNGDLQKANQIRAGIRAGQIKDNDPDAQWLVNYLGTDAAKSRNAGYSFGGMKSNQDGTMTPLLKRKDGTVVPATQAQSKHSLDPEVRTTPEQLKQGGEQQIEGMNALVSQFSPDDERDMAALGALLGYVAPVAKQYTLAKDQMRYDENGKLIAQGVKTPVFDEMKNGRVLNKASGKVTGNASPVALTAGSRLVNPESGDDVAEAQAAPLSVKDRYFSPSGTDGVFDRQTGNWAEGKEPSEQFKHIKIVDSRVYDSKAGKFLTNKTADPLDEKDRYQTVGDGVFDRKNGSWSQKPSEKFNNIKIVDGRVYDSSQKKFLTNKTAPTEKAKDNLLTVQGGIWDIKGSKWAVRPKKSDNLKSVDGGLYNTDTNTWVVDRKKPTTKPKDSLITVQGGVWDVTKGDWQVKPKPEKNNDVLKSVNGGLWNATKKDWEVEPEIAPKASDLNRYDKEAYQASTVGLEAANSGNTGLARKQLADIHKKTNYRFTERGSPISKLPREAKPYLSSIQKASKRFGVQAGMIAAIISPESNWDKLAKSPKNARGLMQVMPETAKEVAKKIGLKNYDHSNPDHNIMVGTAYFSQMMTQHDGNRELAIAAYNAGPGAVAKYGGIPPFKETQNYVPKVMGNYRTYTSDVIKTDAQVKAELATINKALSPSKAAVSVTNNIGGEIKQGKVADGMVRVKDPSTASGYRDVPVDGSKEFEKRKQLEVKKQLKDRDASNASDVVLKNLSQIKSKVENAPWYDPAVGSVMTKITRNVEGSSYLDVQSMVETVSANIGFDRLQQMRDSSPTGGALGSVTEKELTLLSSVIGSLAQVQSEEQFLKKIDEINDRYNKIVHGPDWNSKKATNQLGITDAQTARLAAARAKLRNQ